MERPRTEKPQASKDTQPILFLGLFLLLLAFFIVLNAIAKREEIKSRAVIGSLVSTFSSASPPASSLELFVSALGESPTPEEVTEAMAGLWVSAIRVAKVEMVTPGRTMQIEVPVQEMFVGRTAALRSDREALAIAVARTLATPPRGYVSELQFILGLGETSGIQDVDAVQTQMARATALARELVAHGAPPDAIAVGVRGNGKPARLRLRFDIFREEGSRADFRGVAG